MCLRQMNRKRRKFINTGCILWPAFLTCATVPVLLLQTGCHPGMLAVISTPTSAEAKTSAEYNLTAEKDKKILVFVDQPHSLKTQANMRFLLTDTVNKMLEKRAKVPAEMLVDYETLADFRSSVTDFSLLSPENVGISLGADFVLLMVITDCKISEVSQTGYVNGSLDVQAELIKTASGEKVWPQLERARVVRVGFESKRLGPDAAAVRLALAAAHCVMRYLYDCPKNQFKISDEIRDIGWESKRDL
jgi:hypothetical protein